MYACPWSRGNTSSHGTAYSVKTPLWFELSPAKLFTSMPITDCGWRLHSKWRTTRPKRHAIVPNSKPITQSSDPPGLVRKIEDSAGMIDEAENVPGRLIGHPGRFCDCILADFARQRFINPEAFEVLGQCAL